MPRPWLTSGLVLLLGVSAAATVVVPTEFREVVSGAALIVRGHITDVRGVVVPTLGIESIATIAIDAVLKGRAADFVSIRLPGGTVGRTRAVMVGAPSLRVGQQAVFFLTRDRGSAWRPVGVSMGIYPVQAAPVTGQAVVNPPLVLGQTVAAGPVVRGDPRRRLMGVSEFESLVRVVMAGQSRPAQGGGR